jgi:hypothetical protein
MRAALWVAGVLALGATNTAAAATKLCLRIPGARLDVPTNPSFIVDRLQTDLLIGRTVNVSPLGDYWNRVTLSVREGTTFKDPRRGCSGRRLRATSRWKRHDAAPKVAVDRLTEGGTLSLRIHVAHEDQRDLRVDWAFAAGDLHVGTQGTKFEALTEGYKGPGWIRRVRIPVGTDLELVHLRLTPLLLDGSEGKPWQGWVHHDRATRELRIGQGPAPVPDVRRACAERTPWIVGEHPTFTYAEPMTSFRAVTEDGRVLPTTITTEFNPFYEPPRVTVAAPDGTAFWLEALPVGTGCPVPVRVVKGAHAPRVQVDAAAVSADGQVMIRTRGAIDRHVSVAFGEKKYLYGDVLVPVLGDEIAFVTEPSDWEFETRFARFGPPGVMRVVLTPQRDGFTTHPCELWLDRDTQTLMAPLSILQHERCEDPVPEPPPRAADPILHPRTSTIEMPRERSRFWLVLAVLAALLAAAVARRATGPAALR